MPVFEELRDVSPASMRKLNDMLRFLYKKVQGGITHAELAPEVLEDIATVDADKLVDNAITGDKIGDGQVSGGHIVEAAIGTAHIQDAVITNAKIDRETVNKLIVSTADIETAAIGDAQLDRATANKIVIQNADILRAGINKLVVTDADVADLSASKITAGTIDARDITVKHLNAAEITVGTINGYQISQGAITGGLGGNIAPGTITGQNIAYIEADYIKGGDLTLGGLVNESTYNGRILMRRADGSLYGQHDRTGITYYDADAIETIAIRDNGVSFKDSKIVQYNTALGSGIGIFAL